MLKECWWYLTTPCESWARRMGYLRELISIKSRADRCRVAWESHLEKTKSVIREGIQQVDRRGRAVVLGSGWLLDVPLEELAKGFDEVILVDIVHPRPVLRRIQKFSNVRAMSCDVSGVARRWHDEVLAAIRDGRKPVLPEPGEISLGGIAEVDLVVSVNILSQLHVRLADFLEKEDGEATGKLSGEEWGRFRGQLVRRHLQWLGKAAGSVLITDVESRTVDGAGTQIGQEQLVELPSLPGILHEWLWELAPLGESVKGQRITRQVKAVIAATTTHSAGKGLPAPASRSMRS